MGVVKSVVAKSSEPLCRWDRWFRLEFCLSGLSGWKAAPKDVRNGFL